MLVEISSSQKLVSIWFLHSGFQLWIGVVLRYHNHRKIDTNIERELKNTDIIGMTAKMKTSQQQPVIIGELSFVCGIF